MEEITTIPIKFIQHILNVLEHDGHLGLMPNCELCLLHKEVAEYLNDEEGYDD